MGEGKLYGDAPCGNCQVRAWNIELIPGSNEPADDGGVRWKVATGQSCPTCGEPFIWYHKKMSEVVIYMIQVGDKFGFWTDRDFGHDKMDGLPERMSDFRKRDSFGYTYRLIKRTVKEEVIDA